MKLIFIGIVFLSSLSANLFANESEKKSILNTTNLDFEVCTENIPKNTLRQEFSPGKYFIKRPHEESVNMYTFTSIDNSEDPFETFASIGDFSQNTFPSENFLLPRTSSDDQGVEIYDTMCGEPDNSEEITYYLNSEVKQSVNLLMQVLKLDESGMPIIDDNFSPIYTTENLSQEVSDANRCFTCKKPAKIQKEGYCFYEARNAVLEDLDKNYEFNNLYDAFHSDEKLNKGDFHMTSTFLEFKKINEKDENQIELFSETYLIEFEELLEGQLTKTSTHIKEVTYKFEDGFLKCIESK